MSNSGSKLLRLAELIGGEVQVEYDQLVSDSKRLRQVLEAIEKVSPTEFSESPVQATTTVADRPARETKPRKLSSKQRWISLTDEQRIELVLKALEARSVHGGKFPTDVWHNLLVEAFGFYDSELGRTMRAALARANGKFRPQFRRKIQKVFGKKSKAYLDRLSKV